MNKKDTILKYGCILLLLFWSIYSFWAVFQDSMVIDEREHIAAGYLYLANGVLGFNMSHPPLIKIISAIPLYFGSFIHFETPPLYDQYVHLFYYGKLNNPDTTLFASRLAVVTFNLLLISLCAYLLRYWNNWHINFGAALLTLGNPTFLAHSHFVTFDVPVTLLIFATLLLGIQAFENGKLSFWFFTGIFTTFALLTKATAWILLPFALFPLFLIRSRAWLVALLSPAVALLALFYNHFSHASLAPIYNNYSRLLLKKQFPILIPVLRFLFDHPVTMPLGILLMTVAASAAYIFGGDNVANYFNGTIYHKGYGSYFIKLFFLKEPTGLILLIILTSILIFRYRHILWAPGPLRNLLKAASLFMCLYFGCVFSARINLGLRYMLPIYPWIGILGGSMIGAWIKDKQTSRPLAHLKLPLVATLLAIHFSSLAIVFPFFISFYNLPSGGWRTGYTWAVDSNYDWGQDLYRLQRWIQEHNIARFYLIYSGEADTSWYFKDKIIPINPAVSRPESGSFFAISVFELQFLRARSSADNYLSWLDELTPVDRAGSSILIYKIP